MTQNPSSISGILDVECPETQTCPVVVSVPHSGRNYSDEFLQASKLSDLDIRRSEDAFVDKLFADAPKHGLPMLKALFPRAYVDVNRDAYELDSSLFDTPLPSYVNTASPRAYVGLGTIPGIVTQGMEIYSSKLSLKEALDRIDTCYYPYHANLEALVQKTAKKFGHSILLDCHSMPSPRHRDQYLPDFVLGDRFGTTCDGAFIATIEEFLRANGYTVGRNSPYAGAFVVRHYGKPKQNSHALQIEIRRSLYMNERTLEPTKGLRTIKNLMNGLMEHICRYLDEASLNELQ